VIARLLEILGRNRDLHLHARGVELFNGGAHGV
jgi:hypothetical protein